MKIIRKYALRTIVNYVEGCGTQLSLNKDRDDNGLRRARFQSLLRNFDQKFSALELNSVQLFQEQRNTGFGYVDQGLGRLEMNRTDLADVSWNVPTRARRLSVWREADGRSASTPAFFMV